MADEQNEFKVLSSKSTAEGIALHGAARMALRIGPIRAACPPGIWRPGMVLGKDMYIQGLFAFVDGNRAK